ncbi:MAG: EthD domain-containing protein [Alphaproteobacteria bacterium]
MSKLIYALWGSQNLITLKGATAISQVTETVASAAPLRMGDDLPDALVTFQDHAPDLSPYCERFHGWQVEERVPLPADHSQTGFNQVTLLNFKPDVPREHALTHWRAVHTPLAIETQDTFYYGQNRVLRALTDGAPQIDAIVEEWFPFAAMTDPNTFFDAMGDDDRLAQNRKKMIGSCTKFINFNSLRVIPMTILM